MKKIISFITVFCLLFSFTACKRSKDDASTSSQNQNQLAQTTSSESKNADSSTQTSAESANTLKESEETTDTLVVYFSCTGNTKAVAEKIAELTGADLYEIIPTEPYSEEDLNYNNENSRANQEMNDETARPGIGSEKIDLSTYHTIFLGYPIWWSTMPRIINTFLIPMTFPGK